MRYTPTLLRAGMISKFFFSVTKRVYSNRSRGFFIHTRTRRANQCILPTPLLINSISAPTYDMRFEMRKNPDGNALHTHHSSSMIVQQYSNRSDWFNWRTRISFPPSPSPSNKKQNPSGHHFFARDNSFNTQSTTRTTIYRSTHVVLFLSVHRRPVTEPRQLVGTVRL